MNNHSLSKYANIARPYAVAAFTDASNKNALPEWRSFFNALNTMMSNPLIVESLNNPQIESHKLYELFKDILKDHLTDAQANFLHLLADNGRLNILPEIADQFENYYAQLEQVSQVHVTTAVEIDDAFREKLMAALTKRIKHKVTLETSVDPAIIGGAVLRIGDRVIDASIREQLAKILEFSLR